MADKAILLNNEIMVKKDGFFNLGKDKEAVVEFMKDIKKKMVHFGSVEERIKYLIENNYYYNVLEQYTIEQIIEIDKTVKIYNFKFQSYMAIQKFYKEYALKTNDKKQYLEFYEDRVIISALYLGKGDFKKAKDIAIACIEQRLQMATPTTLNSGKARRGELVSCFLLEMDDSLNSINYVLGTCMQLSKIGGGVAVNLSKLRGRGESIKGVEGAAKGIMPVLKLMEDAFSYADQMGQRRGSGAGYYNIFGWDVIEFLDCKKINADEKARIKTLSIGLIIPSKFYELADQDKPLHVFAPFSVFDAYGVHLDDMDMDEMYEELLANELVTKKKVMSARDMLTKIAQIQLESGYPYIMNKTNANKKHALKDIGSIKMSNLCVTGDTKLLTSNGYIKAKDLYNLKSNLNVVIDNRTKNYDFSETGTSVVEAIPMQLTARQADVYQVKTKEGFQIKATEWHKMYVYRDETVVKIPLKDLREGDKILVQSDEGTYGRINDPDLAYICGLISGDGCIDDTTAIIYLYGDKATIKEVVEAKVEKIIDKYIDKERDYKHNASFKPHFNEGEGRWSLNSQVLKHILEIFFITKETKTSVPFFVLEGTKETQAAYLSGLYQMDGTANCNEKYKAGSIEITQTNVEFLRDIQMMLLNMGIYSTIYDNDNEGMREMPDGKGGKKDFYCKNTYKMTVQDRKSRDKFVEIINLKDVDKKKIENFNKILQPKSRKPKHKFTATVTSVKLFGVEDVYDTTQPDYHSLIFNGIATGNCTEIFQLQETSTITNYGEEDIIRRDISCNLASLNIANVMEHKKVKESVHTGMIALTSVSDQSKVENAAGVRKANEELHSVGLGAMNLNGYLVKNRIPYESEEAKDFTRTFFMLMNFHSIEASMLIAKESGITFKDFERSEYAKGTYFDMYLEEDFSPKTDKVKKLFEGIPVATKKEWKNLKEFVQKHGLYHAYRLAVAPTQSISYIQNATSSVMPIVEQIETRTYANSTTYYPMPYLDKTNIFYYKSAYNMDMLKMIDLIAEAQRHVDQGISTILFVNSNVSTRELARYYLYAHHKGLFSLYYTRTKKLSVEECTSCAI